jgi:hypothetical protein
MKRLVPVPLLLALAWPAAPAASRPSSAPIRRFALVVGANRGAPDRVPLRYAVVDAERFAEVVTRMGGVAAADRTVLRDPTRQALLDALGATAGRAGQARAEASRVEVIVYFSGHADDQGLMLGRETLPYRELRTAVGAMGADVGITILDACASGAITRWKGGQIHPAFLSDASQVVQGYAFLTSSSENEAAQESERLRGSFFTHALLTGLRGAADMSGDGRVTLSEAYQFAFQETLVQTAPTQAGAQHPTYDIKMAGTGDVVMTDVARNSASLILGPDYDGRFFVLDAQRHLVAELYKPAGRRVELGVEPGAYDVFYEQEKKLLSAALKLDDGQHQELVRGGLRETRRRVHPIRGQGPEGAAPDLLDGRFRAQVGVNELSFLHWFSPRFGVDVTFGESWDVTLSDVSLSGRFYPRTTGRVRPYGLLGLGEAQSYPYEQSTFGFIAGAGLDTYLGRHFSLGLNARQFLHPGGHSPRRLSLTLGWTFGGGH